MFSKLYLVPLISLFCILQEVLATKLYCQIYKKNENPNIEINTKYGQINSEIYVCDAFTDKCCEKGCCSLVAKVPWYVWVLIIIAIVVFCLIGIIILYFLKMLLIAMTARGRRDRTNILLTTVTNTTVSSSCKSERPPSYETAVYLPVPITDDKVPSYEEATR